VTPSTPPTLSMSGSMDDLIPAATMRNVQPSMQKAGVRCDVIIYPEQGHGFFNKQAFKHETQVAVDRFLISLEWLAGPPTLNQDGGHASVDRQ